MKENGQENNGTEKASGCRRMKKTSTKEVLEVECLKGQVSTAGQQVRVTVDSGKRTR